MTLVYKTEPWTKQPIGYARLNPEFAESVALAFRPSEKRDDVAGRALTIDTTQVSYVPSSDGIALSFGGSQNQTSETFGHLSAFDGASSAWALARFNLSGMGGQVFGAWAAVTGTNTQFAPMLVNSDGSLICAVYQSATGVVGWQGGAGTFPLNQWVTAVVCWSGNGSESMTCWVNGKPIALTQNIGSAGTNVTLTTQTNSYLQIGTRDTVGSCTGKVSFVACGTKVQRIAPVAKQLSINPWRLFV